MNIALIEMRRAKLRFGLLAGAVALLIFLVIFLSALSSALVNSLTGALKTLDAPVLAYSAPARDNLQASRLPEATVAKVAEVSGVADAGGVATATVPATFPPDTQSAKASLSDLQLFAFTPGKPGAPTALTSGELPTSEGQTAVDVPGAKIGDVITLKSDGTSKPIPLKVVGLLRGAQFSGTPTAYVTLTEYGTYLKETNPALPFVPINAVAATLTPGASATEVADAITGSVPGVKGYEQSTAVSLIPGIASISQTFGILVGLTFIISIVVIGFFFLILTVQKLRVFTLLRAVGASGANLSATLALQIAIVVVVASALASLLAYGALKGLNSGIPVTLSPILVLVTTVAVLIASLIAGMLSISRIRKIDPATAAGAR